ncbi:unannotated protein [freshwater metagenome]|uniref:Unannotated protein n=1 Tax=freshwater metagenome TaxID=449393 RepID=A0A6J6F271_9ZZZZ
MKKISRKLAYLFISITILSTLLLNVIGSSVNENGVLVEPFFLIPLSYLSFILGIVFAVISVIKKK